MKLTRRELLKTSIFLTASSIGCPHILEEIGRSLFLGDKIEHAKKQMDMQDKKLAETTHTKVYEVGRKDFKFEDGMNAAVWFPVEKENNPGIYFSHGYGMSIESYLNLCRGFARRGYAVFGVDHEDTLSMDRIRSDRINSLNDILLIDFPEVINAIQDLITGINTETNSLNYLNLLFGEGLKNPEEVRKKFDYRIQESYNLINRMRKINSEDLDLKGKINLDEITGIGHSMGGWTIIQMASEYNVFNSLVCMSPASEWIEDKTLNKIDIPTMYMTGSYDSFKDHVKNSFEKSNPSKAYQNFLNIGHLGFSDRAFLYGLGIPFISQGQVGFSADLEVKEFEKIAEKLNLLDLIQLGSHYAEQLNNYQIKAIKIAEGAYNFIDSFSLGNIEAYSRLYSMENSPLLEDSLIKI